MIPGPDPDEAEFWTLTVTPDPNWSQIPVTDSDPLLSGMSSSDPGLEYLTLILIKF